MRSDWLDAFLEFSDRLNFTHAAEALHISQPALHVKIRNLADSLGMPLYHRVGRNLILTPAGRRVASFAREQSTRSRNFLEDLQTGASQWPVKLCAGDGAYLYLLGPAISRFLESGDHKLTLLTGNRDRTLELVLSGEAHLGVSSLGYIPEGIAAETLTEVDQCLVMPDGHPLARRRKLGLEDLEDESLIVPPQDRPHRIMLNQMLAAAGVRWQVAVEANGWELMLQFVSLGVGLAVINGSCHIPPGLTAKPLKALPSIRYQILHRADGPPHGGALSLRKYLLQDKNAWRTR